MDQVFWYQSLHPSHHNVLSPGVISLVSGLESQDQVPSSLYNYHYHHHYYLYILIIITILLIPSFSSSLLWISSNLFIRSPGEGNGNPLQYSCLENPVDWGAWWATVHGVAKSRTRLSNFTSRHLFIRRNLFHVSVATFISVHEGETMTELSDSRFDFWTCQEISHSDCCLCEWPLYPSSLVTPRLSPYVAEKS